MMYVVANVYAFFFPTFLLTNLQGAFQLKAKPDLHD
jgi:hypothetical protein